MYNAALARLKKKLLERRETLRAKYDNGLGRREYLIQVGQVRELNLIIAELDAQLKQPEDEDDAKN